MRTLDKIFMPAVATSLFALITLSAQAQPAAGSVDAGRRAFAACAACHSIDGSAKPMGPTLKGIVGRKAASVSAYTNYSKALKDSGLTWDEATLRRYLAAPTQVVPGTTMLVNVPSEAQRNDLLAYLATLQP